MLDCISVENMRQSDAYTIENFVPSLELMHRAAWGVYLAVQNWGKTAIVVGSGNNGGDGYALACILQKHGCDCTVFRVGEKMSEDSAYYFRKAVDAGIPVEPFMPNCLAGFSCVVDCLLGTGFQGAVRGNYRAAIEQINASGANVVSIDINSGMNGDTGEGELIVRSDLTVTIGYVKKGLITPNAGRFMKKLVCADIGILLMKEEGKITEENCPLWLDMQILKAYE